MLTTSKLRDGVIKSELSRRKILSTIALGSTALGAAALEIKSGSGSRVMPIPSELASGLPSGSPSELLESAIVGTANAQSGSSFRARKLAKISEKVARAAVQAIFIDFDVDAAKALLAPDYIQHNQNVPTGAAAILGLIPALKESNIKLDIHRTIVAGNLVAFHTTYTNAEAFGVSTAVGFDVYRVENGRVAEHWDNLQVPKGLSPGGHSMTDGPTEVVDLDKTAENRAFVTDFIQTVLVRGQTSEIQQFFSEGKYINHNASIADGVAGLLAVINGLKAKGTSMVFHRTPVAVAQGNFVMLLSEGTFAGTPTAFFDLFRVEDGKIAEHWDVVTPLQTKNLANDNGKF